MKKIFALVLAMMMVLTMGAVAFADTQDSGKGGDASITITLPTQQVAPTGTTTYKIYKVFDATNDGDSEAISYSVMASKEGVELPTGFVVDKAGNVHHGTLDENGVATDDNATDLTAEEIAAIVAYVGSDAPVYTAEVAAGEATVVVTGLEYGYYYITTSTGTVVTIDSTNPNANVEDKNVIPKVVKSEGTEYDAASMAAIAEVGTSKDFTAQINIGKGAKNLVFTDTMTNMTFNGTVTITVSAGTAPVAGTDYTLTGAAGDSTFSIKFEDAYLAKLADNTLINITYAGTVTSDALSTDPATNTAKITSGDGNESSSEPVNVYNAKFTVTKKDGKGAALEGAGFVIKNEAGKYYKLADDKKSISWVDSIDDATEYKSDSTGAVPAFTGLGVGKYTLVEKTTPDGYNTAADSNFEIKDADYTSANLEQTADVINESGAVLPSTGGVGTTIFYIAGSILVLAAAVLLITKRRMGADD